MTIGINNYQHCGPLENAVGDAEGAREAFTSLGFQSLAHLTNKGATNEAMHRLVHDDLQRLDKDDSLVVFFAGHGFTHERTYADTTRTRTGYLVPFDGDKERPGTCVRIRSWLDEIAHLAPRHILIILDACKSGIALEPMMLWHSTATHAQVAGPWERLRQRRSRRVFTSAADDEFAWDSGPREGNSLFTGYLLEALSGGMQTSSEFVSAETIGSWVKHQVMCFPKSKQNPGFGALQLHDNGDLVVSLPAARTTSSGSSFLPPRPHDEVPLVRGEWSNTTQGQEISGRGASGKRKGGKAAGKPPKKARGSKQSPQKVEQLTREGPRLRRDAGFLDAAFAAALERQSSVRKQGAVVLTTVMGEPQDAAAAMATYSARRGALTLRTSATEIDAATKDLLAHVPWPRCLPTARTLFAHAANRPVEGLLAAFESRTEREIREWVEEVGRNDPTVSVAGWLIDQLRNPFEPLNVDTAPENGRALLAAVGDLCGALAVSVHHDEPSDEWFGSAVRIAGVLASQLPRHSVSISAPFDMASRVLNEGHDSMSKAMARQGMVRCASARRPANNSEASPVADLRALEGKLLETLQRDPRTCGRFERHVRAPIHERQGQVEVLAAARRECLIVEIDRWYQLDDAAAYQQARLKDIWLQRAGFLCLRFPAEDVVHRLPAVLDEICAGLDGRRGQRFIFDR